MRRTLDDVTPFTPNANAELLERFWFAPNWTTEFHLVGIEPLLDNAAAREWTLYLKMSASEGPGTHQRNNGLNASGLYLLAGWSSEAPNMPIPDDAGIRIAQGERVRLALEIHYNTTSSANRADRSGVRLCLSRSLRAKEAALHWLGTDGFVNRGAPGGSFMVSGSCTALQASHLVGYLPRMRRYGRRMRIVTQRNGMKYPLVDRPFDLNSKQFVVFPSEVSVAKGEVLNTTCTYDAERPFQFGLSEDDEECFALMLAWPAGSLSHGFPNVVGGENSCLGWD